MNPIETINQNFTGIIDTTLREGEQFAGEPVEFTLDQATKVLGFLYQIGVDRAEVPNPTAIGMDQYISQLVRVKNRPPLLAHTRNHLQDVQAAIITKVEGVNILTTVDDDRLRHIGHDLDSYLVQLQQVISTAQAHHLETRVSVEHSWDSDFDKAMQVYRLAQELGVDRIGVADTVGRATHWQVAEKITHIRRQLPRIPIEVHFHNDFLSAVANSLEAVASGANWVDTTLAGIGERTGITPLSVFLARLYTLQPDTVSRYQIDLVTQAEAAVVGIIDIDLPFNLLTAPNAFSHKAGIHINGVMQNGPQLYEPLPPKTIGNQRRLITGTRISGRTTQKQVDQFIQENGTG